MMNAFKPREPRQKVVLPAKMRAGAGQMEVCIRDISSRGMLVQAGTPPPRGTYVEILRPGCAIAGRVVWTKHHKFGILAQGRISVAAVLERRKVPRPGGGTPPTNQGGAIGIKPQADPAQRAARARARAAVLQYAAVGGAAALGALLLAFALYSSLSGTVAEVAQHLR
ncbi:MAG TPA: PilZ domain-containing protein [Allosphingosinicella sp.]|nr:PilZ domain-containing protein [Allosphingosinicella sp.]